MQLRNKKTTPVRVQATTAKMCDHHRHNEQCCVQELKKTHFNQTIWWTNGTVLWLRPKLHLGARTFLTGDLFASEKVRHTSGYFACTTNVATHLQ